MLGEAPLKRRDHMESFWLSESLKYLWLLFSDDGAHLQLLILTLMHTAPKVHCSWQCVEMRASAVIEPFNPRTEQS